MREAIKSLTNYTLTDEDLNQFRVSYDNYSWFVSFAPYENPEILLWLSLFLKAVKGILLLLLPEIFMRSTLI